MIRIHVKMEGGEYGRARRMGEGWRAIHLFKGLVKTLKSPLTGLLQAL